VLFDDSLREKLKELVDNNSQTWAYDAHQAESLLRQNIAGHEAEIGLLLQAQELSVPWELLNAVNSMDREFVERLIVQMEQSYGLTYEASKWAIESWAFAFDIALPPPTQYYVIDGENRFGPAPLEILKQWVAEGRLRMDMSLEEVGSGKQVPVTQLQGLLPNGSATGFSGETATTGSNYYRPPVGDSPEQLLRDSQAALIKSAICAFCIGFLPVGLAAFIIAYRARTQVQLGNFAAAAKMIRTANLLSSISLAIGIALLIYTITSHS
jgi:hypothetical protein